MRKAALKDPAKGYADERAAIDADPDGRRKRSAGEDTSFRSAGRVPTDPGEVEEARTKDKAHGPAAPPLPHAEQYAARREASDIAGGLPRHRVLHDVRHGSVQHPDAY